MYDDPEQSVTELQETIESLQVSLAETASELATAKKAYRERRTEHLRELVAAKDEATVAVREELRALNLPYRTAFRF